MSQSKAAAYYDAVAVVVAEVWKGETFLTAFGRVWNG
jgi:hypothetical protein